MIDSHLHEESRAPEGLKRTAPLTNSREAQRPPSPGLGNRAIEALLGQHSPLPASAEAVLGTTGTSLPSGLRVLLESRLGPGLEQVRIHTGSAASESAGELHARAYTLGNHIVLGGGMESLSPLAASYVVAHELAHVRQAGATHADATGVGASNAPELQANRMAASFVAGGSAAEPPVAAGGLRRAPDDQPVPVAASTVRPAPAGPAKPQRWEPTSMPERLLRWEAEGLLDPPFRPEKVAAIPPLKVTPKQAQQLPMLMAGVGGAAAAQRLETATEVATQAARPTLTLIRGGAGAALETAGEAAPSIASRVLSFAKPATGPLLFLTILLTPSSTEEAWVDTWSKIAEDSFCQSAEEAAWQAQLAPEQVEYLRWLERARRLAPDPSVDEETDPSDLPRPLPQPRTRKKEEEPTACFERDVPRRGGHRRHDAYATKVSKSTEDHYVRSRVGLSITYDGLEPLATVWEVKVGFGWFFNPDFAALRDIKLAEWDAQRSLGLAVALNCDLLHLWSIPDRWVAQLLNQRWAFLPPVLSLPE